MPAGTCATVCQGGYVSGGGVGLLTPHSGLGSDHLLAAEVVLADGRVVTASPESEPDLLWALQGGGSNFGVITRFTLRAEPLSDVTSYVMAWPFEAADRVGGAWQRRQAERPDALGRAITLMHPGEISRRGDGNARRIAGRPTSALGGTGGANRNCPEADLPDWRHAYGGENVERLMVTKRHYDPHNAFAQTQGIPG